jgi:hypothetical protein
LNLEPVRVLFRMPPCEQDALGKALMLVSKVTFATAVVAVMAFLVHQGIHLSWVQEFGGPVQVLAYFTPQTAREYLLVATTLLGWWVAAILVSSRLVTQLHRWFVRCRAGHVPLVGPVNVLVDDDMEDVLFGEGNQPESMRAGSELVKANDMSRYQAAVLLPIDGNQIYAGLGFRTHIEGYDFFLVPQHVVMPLLDTGANDILLTRDLKQSVRVNMSRAFLLETDVLVIPVQPVAMSKLGVKAVRSAKAAETCFANVVGMNARFQLRQTFGLLTEGSVFGMSEYHGSTVPGFSGALVESAGVPVAMHLGGSRIRGNYGFFVGYLLCLLKAQVCKHETTAEWLLRAYERRGGQKVKAQRFGASRSEFVIKYAGNYHMVDLSDMSSEERQRVADILDVVCLVEEMDVSPESPQQDVPVLVPEYLDEPPENQPHDPDPLLQELEQMRTAIGLMAQKLKNQGNGQGPAQNKERAHKISTQTPVPKVRESSVQVGPSLIVPWGLRDGPETCLPTVLRASPAVWPVPAPRKVVKTQTSPVLQSLSQAGPSLQTRNAKKKTRKLQKLSAETRSSSTGTQTLSGPIEEPTPKLLH